MFRVSSSQSNSNLSTSAFWRRRSLSYPSAGVTQMARALADSTLSRIAYLLALRRPRLRTNALASIVCTTSPR